jgi:hypothetical protein
LVNKRSAYPGGKYRGRRNQWRRLSFSKFVRKKGRLMFGFNFWYTSILLVSMTVVLVKEYLEADLAVFSVLLLLICGGVIDVKEAFAGFSN